MNYEKKYKQALEKMKAWAEGKYPECFDSAQKTAELIFPELRESEGEKIRKAIIEFFELQDDNTTYSFITKKDIIAWLEKQEEIKIPKWIFDFLEECRPYIGCALGYDERRDIDGKVVAVQKWLEKQGEQKPADKIEQEYHCTGVREPKEATGVLKQLLNKEKPAWSEEDEELFTISLDNLIELNDRYGEEYGRVGECIRWFKSIKDRVQPQPKQEWSDTDLISLGYLAYFVDNNGDKFYGKNKPDVVKWIYSFANRTAPQQERSEEDKVRINRIVAFLEKLNLEYLNVAGNDILLKDIEWLKSLKERYTWKPSDAQMIALNDAITNGHLSNANERILKGLQEQLKKL